MTLSIVTAVDSLDHLDEAYESLTAQTSGGWEWVVVCMGDVTVGDAIANDEHVQVVAAPAWIGELGKEAATKLGCEKAGGDYFLDLDQFNALSSDAVERYVGAFDGGADVVYGDFANIPITGPPLGYDASYGWETYGVEHRGAVLRAVRTFEPSASSMHHASYAPSVGVAWRRSTYFAAGGHVAAAGSAAESELTCRAYLDGANVQHLDACVVFSRRHAYLQRDLNAEQQHSNRCVYDVIKEWSRREGLRLLDLGAAHNPAPGFESVDLQDAQINCDIRHGLPLADNSVGCIRAVDFLEHMNHCPDSACTHGADGESLRCSVGVMNEFYRVLAPGGWLVSRTPSTDGRGAFQDPTHVSFWNPNSFWYYTRRDQARFVRGVECRFQASRLWQAYPDGWHEENKILYVYADLVALKGQRQPGLCEI